MSSKVNLNYSTPTFFFFYLSEEENNMQEIMVNGYRSLKRVTSLKKIVIIPGSALEGLHPGMLREISEFV